MAQPYRVMIIEQSQVAPPPNSVPTTSLPLTFFDIPWIPFGPMQRLFFYEFPQSTKYFKEAILPNLKHSLSLTLQHFFPFAANLVCPPQTQKPHILYEEGNSVSFTVAEAAGDFKHLMANYPPRDVSELHSFVAQMPPTHVSSDNTRVIPIMAMQITVFPNEGICVGITFCHVAADGRAFHYFIKSWASVFKTRGKLACLDRSLPFHDKALIKDPNGLEHIYLADLQNLASAWKEDTSFNNDITDKLRATFVLGRAQIEALKQWVRGQCVNKDLEQLHISTFVVTCALIWVCLIKSEHSGVSNFSVNSKQICYFTFVADCRNRLEFPIPSTYFGNCLAMCFVPLERCELVGETGILEAAKAIGNKVRKLEIDALRGAETWLLDFKELLEQGNPVTTVAGSPSLGIYETDFGWGRPKKCELVHIDVTGAISLAECRDEDGAIEIGVALSRSNMSNFIAIWEQSLMLF